MAVFVNDTFSGEVTDVLLENHTPEAGGPWVKHASAGVPSGVVMATGRCRNTDDTDFAGEDAFYYVSGTPAGAEYDVVATVAVQTVNNSEVQLHGRLDPASNTRYSAIVDATTVSLFKVVAGTYTSLGSAAHATAWTATENHTVELRVTDATKKVFIDSVERLSSTDNAITAAAKAGLSIRNITAELSGIHVDSFSATDTAAAGETRKARPVMLGRQALERAASW